MAKLGVRLSKTAAGCSKVGCDSHCGHLARHHIRHQSLWLGIWAGTRNKDPRWWPFVERYRAFHKDDVEMLGAWHHAEVHVLYDIIIEEHKKLAGIGLRHYTWEMAEDLMKRLEQAYNRWVKIPTPGFAPQLYNYVKKNRLAIERGEPLQSHVRKAHQKYLKHRAYLLQKVGKLVCTVQKVPAWRAEQ